MASQERKLPEKFTPGAYAPGSPKEGEQPMAAAATITCPSCGKTMRGSLELDGKKVRCPQCRAGFVARLGESLKVDVGGAGAAETLKGKPVQPAAPGGSGETLKGRPAGPGETLKGRPAGPGETLKGSPVGSGETLKGTPVEVERAELPEGAAWMTAGLQPAEEESAAVPWHVKKAASNPVVDPNLTPLLDVVLQLIMFFMITVNFVQTEALNEEVDLPAASSATPLDQTGDDYIFLNMNKKGKLVGYLDDLNNPIKLKAHLMREADARRRAAAEKGRKGDVNIIIVLRADKNARYADVWEVLHTCQDAGYKRWQLRVMTKS
jgi:biopolymer transport protein ExbD